MQVETPEKELLSSEERDAYASENFGLIYHIANKFRSNKRDFEEIIGSGTLGMTKAVKTFDKNAGIKFSTYASTCITNEILQYFRRDKKHDNNISIETTIYNDKDGSEISLLDIIAAKEKEVDWKDINSVTNLIYQGLEGKKKVIFKQWVEGRKHSDIGKALGLSQSYITRIIGTILKKIKREYWRETGMKQAQGDMAEAKRLLAETDLSVKEIADRTGTNKNSLKVYAHKMKNKAEAKQGAPVIAQNKPTWSKSEEEYKTLICQLEGELEGRDDLIGKLEATIKKYEQSPSPDEDIKILNEKVESVEDELDQYKTKLRIAANALDQSNEQVEKLRITVEDYKKELVITRNYVTEYQEEAQELRSKQSTVERELLIAEENLTAANKSLRNKDAALEQLERELSYARENERTLKANDLIFKAALKAAL